MGTHDETHRRSIEDADRFWLEAAGAIEWEQPPTRGSEGPGRWFADGVLSTAHNALDRHVAAGHGDVPALIHDSPVTGTVATWTYREARDEVARLAGALRWLGVTRDDRVLISMPMVPQAIFAMLACARLGAAHVVVFGGFAARELAARIDHTTPKVVLSASCGIDGTRTIAYKPLLDEALALAAHRPEHVVVLQREQATAELREGEQEWEALLAGAEPAPCTPVAATDPLYVLHTSGTTRTPKGVVRDHGGYAVALAWSMANVYDVGRGDVFWAASDVGWVVGHSYIVYAPLLVGATTVLYEGKPVGTPDAGAFWRVIAQHGVNVLFTTPTALRAIKKEDQSGAHAAAHNRSSLRALFLAGERTDPDTYAWAAELLGVPVVDHWWQTETGWPIAANCLGLEQLPFKPGSPTKPVPGYAVEILGEDGAPVATGEQGAIAIRLPLPPGCLSGLWGDPGALERAYLTRFPGCYETGDGGYLDDDGYLFVMGRLDDVINVAGHRLSTGAMEEVVAAHPAVAECAVIGAGDELKGQMPVVFAVAKAGAEIDPAMLAAELRECVRTQIGAIATPRAVHVVERLPKTRSGKTLRAAMRKLLDGEQVAVPPTIDDPGALAHIREVVAAPSSGS
jgi:propionyl-CoA synthetase